MNNGKETAVINQRRVFLSQFLNTILLITGSYGLYHCTRIVLPDFLSVAGHKQFLTNISLGISLCYNLLSVLTQCSNHYVEEVLFPIALVLETVVAIVYWPLKIFFIHLIFQPSSGSSSSASSPLSTATTTVGTPRVQKTLGSKLTLKTDLCLHLFPCIGLIVNYFIYKDKPFQISKRQSFVACILLGSAYKYYLNQMIDTENGAKYPYPFLDAPEPIKSIIMYSVTSLCWVVYLLFQKSKFVSKRKDL